MTKKSVLIFIIILYFGVILLTSLPFQHTSLFKNNASFSLNNNFQSAYAEDDKSGEDKKDKKDKKDNNDNDKNNKKDDDKNNKKDDDKKDNNDNDKNNKKDY